MSEIPQAIFKHWTHSYEEDTEDVRVYRPNDYEFPLSRGRRGFEIKESGKFIQYDIAPTDGSERRVGHWKAEGTNRIKIYFEDRDIQSYTLDIVSCDGSTLRIKKYRPL